tara:strand:- start:91464 stop:92315 length:852 start_codon:yes stop_codon:yes gene_type:complete
VKLGLQHVGILTADMAASIDFYVGCMGMRVVACSAQGGDDNRVYLWDGNPACKVLLLLAGPPFTGWLQQDFSSAGPGMYALSFVTHDIQASEQFLRSAGVESLTGPDSGAGPGGISFRDPAGVHIQLRDSADAIALPQAVPGDCVAPGYSLSHLCHTSLDASPHTAFYRNIMGLETLRELPNEGMIFLGDPLSMEVPGRYVCPLELIAAPGLWQLEKDFLKRRGAGLQWICFSTDSVAAAHARLTERRVPCTLGPTQYGDTEIAFYRDPSGVDIEVLLPHPSA